MPCIAEGVIGNICFVRAVCTATQQWANLAQLFFVLQNEIRIIEESYTNYKTANEESTALAMKFYAAVPTLHERVAAGASFDE